ncbi:MAG: hypothetical protein ACH0QD_13155 [Tepidibacillus sp.]
MIEDLTQWKNENTLLNIEYFVKLGMTRNIYARILSIVEHGESILIFDEEKKRPLKLDITQIEQIYLARRKEDTRMIAELKKARTEKKLVKIAIEDETLLASVMMVDERENVVYLFTADEHNVRKIDLSKITSVKSIR